VRFESYDLELDVDFARSQVKGVVDIKVREAEDPLLLDAVGMQISGVRVNGVDSKSSFDKARGSLMIPGIPEKESVVQVSFAKEVSDAAITGLYKSKYGRDHFLVTDLEPADARTVFPCKDSPSYKAVFRLRVVTDTDLTVISNTELVSKEELPGGRARFTFEPSPRMSTYLFFLGIGRFEEMKKKPGRVAVIAASRPGRAKDSEFIIDASSALLEGYERYFGIRYPLRKLHLIALPEFTAGAMENWGAITSREALVLLNRGSSVANRREAVHVMSHEIAHQWFGDLVTMRWWDDLWLNESFATFMDHKMLERLRPEWDNWMNFLRLHTFRSLNADALSGTHPIQASVKTVNEIVAMFDEISYGKGASILRMIEAYVGQGPFRKGVSRYLRKFAYSNAKGEDLWKSVAETSGLPVSRIARAWITKPGFPLVRVATFNGGVGFSQTRFSFSRKVAKDVWPIPLTMTIDGRHRKTLFDHSSASVQCKDPMSLVVNPRRTGFYSVLYDEDLYDRIADGFAALHSHDRAGVVNDLYLFMQAGTIKPSLYFHFVSLCGDLVDPLTSQVIAEQLVNLRAIAEEAPVVRNGYSRFYTSQFRKLGLSAREGEDESLAEVREVISLQLAMTSPPFARKLSRWFDHYQSVEPSLKSAVAVSYAVGKGEAAFDALVGLVKNEKSETERERIYRALTSFSDPLLVEKSLELSTSGEVSRSDSVYTLTGASTNPNARSVLLNWLTSRYDLLCNTYGGSSRFFRLMNLVIPRCGIGQETEVHKLISGRRYKEGEMTLKRSLELLKINSALRQRLLAA
jgi:tricorn protease interacting factor F2/3